MITKSVQLVLKKNVAIKKNEKVLIVTDKQLLKLANYFYKESKKITQTNLLIIPVAKVHGQEPPKKISEVMKEYDVELLITTKSLTHTQARKNASKYARIVTMPGISKETLQRALNIDYKQLNHLNNKIAKILNKGNKVRITTKLGTDITFSIKGRFARDLDDGILTKKGDYGNLPAGECYIAPVENSANGVFIVDASIGGIGKVDKPVRVFMKNGSAIRFSGGKAAQKWESVVRSVGKKARIIAEFGIGTNPKAKITGNVLEDEKVQGTCHIALGNNTGFGGKNKVQLHMDGVIKKPTIYVDDRKIMESGKFLF